MELESGMTVTPRMGDKAPDFEAKTTLGDKHINYCR